MIKQMTIEHTSSEEFLKQISSLIEEKLNSFFSYGLKKENDTELLTIEETADLLKVCKTSIYNYTKMGILKRKGIGNSARYDKREVLESLENQTIKNTI